MSTTLEDMLNSLGKGVKAIERTLVENSIVGVPGNICRCPVARYLATKLNSSATVDSKYICVAGYGEAPTPTGIRLTANTILP